MWTIVPLIAMTPRKNAIASSQNVRDLSAALASMPGSDSELVAADRRRSVSHGGSRTKIATGSQARMTTAMPRPK